MSEYKVYEHGFFSGFAFPSEVNTIYFANPVNVKGGESLVLSYDLDGFHVSIIREDGSEEPLEIRTE